MNNRRDADIWKNIDWQIVGLYLFLVIYGWVSIYASSYKETHSSIFDFDMAYGRQFVLICMAFVIAMLIIMLDGRIISQNALFVYLAIIGILIATLAIGKTIAGSKSWVIIGPFSFQPAEFAKFGTALLLSSYLASLNIDMKSIKTKIISATIVLLPAALVLLQNDTGTALVFASFFLPMYREGMPGIFFIIGIIAIVIFVLTLILNIYVVAIVTTAVVVVTILLNRKTIKNISKFIAIGIVAIAFSGAVEFVFYKLNDYQQVRIEVLLGLKEDLRGAGYNVHQSMIAIGSGQTFGKGFLQGTQTKLNYVPEQTTDFVFCTVGEEQGFLGTTIVILVFVYLMSRIMYKAEKQRSAFSRIYGYSVVGIIFFHFFVNIGMTIGLIPVIGIPLPFFSYGGSSLWGFTILLFIFIKLDSRRQELF